MQPTGMSGKPKNISTRDRAGKVGNNIFPRSKEGGALRAPLFLLGSLPLAPAALQRPSPPSPLCVHAAPEVRSAGSRTVVFFCKISRKMSLFFTHFCDWTVGEWRVSCFLMFFGRKSARRDVFPGDLFITLLFSNIVSKTVFFACFLACVFVN